MMSTLPATSSTPLHSLCTDDVFLKGSKRYNELFVVALSAQDCYAGAQLLQISPLADLGAAVEPDHPCVKVGIAAKYRTAKSREP